jgi:hypothetical protein
VITHATAASLIGAVYADWMQSRDAPDGPERLTVSNGAAGPSGVHGWGAEADPAGTVIDGVLHTRALWAAEQATALGHPVELR